MAMLWSGAGPCGRNIPVPMPPLAIASLEPQAPRLRQHDVTIEKVAELLANAAAKNLLRRRWAARAHSVGVARTGPFRLGHRAPRVEWAIRALDRLRELDLQPGDPLLAPL
jgi:hypothetical protein